MNSKKANSSFGWADRPISDVSTAAVAGLTGFRGSDGEAFVVDAEFLRQLDDPDPRLVVGTLGLLLARWLLEGDEVLDAHLTVEQGLLQVAFDHDLKLSPERVFLAAEQYVREMEAFPLARRTDHSTTLITAIVKLIDGDAAEPGLTAADLALAGIESLMAVSMATSRACGYENAVLARERERAGEGFGADQQGAGL